MGSRSRSTRVNRLALELPYHSPDLHLDIVWPQYTGRQNLYWRKTKFMLFTLCAPEYISTVAIEQFCEARRSKRYFQALGFHEWTLTHRLFTAINKFPVKSPDGHQYTLRLGQLNWILQEGLVVDFPAISIEILSWMTTGFYPKEKSRRKAGRISLSKPSPYVSPAGLLSSQ
jgi:hypothetical protein